VAWPTWRDTADLFAPPLPAPTYRRHSSPGRGADGTAAGRFVALVARPGLPLPQSALCLCGQYQWGPSADAHAPKTQDCEIIMTFHRERQNPAFSRARAVRASHRKRRANRLMLDCRMNQRGRYLLRLASDLGDGRCPYFSDQMSDGLQRLNATVHESLWKWMPRSGPRTT
jgi:hypothetical protein